MELIFFAVLIYFVAGCMQFAVSADKKFNILSVLNTIATILLIIPAVDTLINNYQLNEIITLNPIIGNLIFRLDALASLFVLIIGVICLIGTYYAAGYLKPYIQQGKSISSHLFLFNIFLISMISVVLSQNIIFFLISWEVMSLSSFLLLIFESEKKEVRTIGVNYLIKMHICVLFLIVGFILLNLKTNSLDFLSFNGYISDIIFLILFTGFGIKAGIVPFHTWLPKAHPVAPTHISALMSGVMIKTGIYGILRITTFYNPTLKVAYIVLLVGLASAFFGILYSIAQRNYKKMLAYSSIENIGIICTALGVGLSGMCYNNHTMAYLGFLGCLLHILNHSLFKTMLFMNVGAVYNKVHTKDMERLGGLINKMPKTAGLFLLGALAISAIPPFNGFISEFLIYCGFLTSFSVHNEFLTPVIIVSIAILAFVGAMALISFSNAFGIIFLGNARDENAKHVDSETSKTMLIPMFILGFCIVLIGLFPQYIVKLFEMPLEELTDSPATVDLSILNNISEFNIALLVIISVILTIRYFALKNKPVSIHETWGCGYDKGSAKIQYSANSFTRPFLGFLTPFYVRTLNFKQIKELFPQNTSFKSSVNDLFNAYLIEPIIKISNLILKKFYWIQSGNTQTYLLYGVIFLIISLICLLGGIL